MAQLARLEMSEGELMQLQGDLNALLDNFEGLKELDVTGRLPKPHAVALQNVLADDRVEPGLPRERALSTSSSTRAGLFIVPTILEG